MKRMLMAVLFLAPCVLGNTTPCDAALRRTVIVKGWQPGETFADGSVVNQNNVYFQKRVPVTHFDHPVVTKQRVRIYRAPVILIP